jgi:lipocalin-like protein
MGIPQRANCPLDGRIGHAPASSMSGGSCYILGAYSFLFLAHRPGADMTSEISRNPLLGTWRLKSIEGILPKRALFSMGPKPRGLLIYAPTGYMAAQIVRDPGPSFPAGYEDATPEEIKNAFEGYYAYFGKYEVDVAKETVTHHLESSLRPAEIGKDYVRAFRFDGDRLFLTPVREGTKLKVRLVWQRVQ